MAASPSLLLPMGNGCSSPLASGPCWTPQHIHSTHVGNFGGAALCSGAGATLTTPSLSTDGRFRAALLQAALKGVDVQHAQAAAARARGEEERRVEELQPGACVRVADGTFEVTEAIGEGTFGVVWGAKCSSTGSSIAIKEVKCASEEQAMDAMREAHILVSIRSAVRGAECNEGRECGRLPLLVSWCSDRAGPAEWRVRMAMTQIAGESLNRFLRRRRLELDCQNEIECATTGQPLTLPHVQFAHACRVARELVSQLAAAFCRISALAYHRDVNPRNILVEDRAGDAAPCFGLIDFGLAVDAGSWRLGKAQSPSGEIVVGTWQVLGVSGDCRYWPVSAWLMLEQGPRALVARPTLCSEYKTHLDLHALGATALQVLAELAPAPSSPLLPTGIDDCQKARVSEAVEMLRELTAAWDRYWEFASRVWRRLFDAYRENDATLARVKAECRTSEVHAKIAESLHAIRDAAKAASEACFKAPPDSGLRAATPLLQALAVLISSGDEPSQSGWRKIQHLVGPSEAVAPSASQVSSVPSAPPPNSVLLTHTAVSSVVAQSPSALAPMCIGADVSSLPGAGEQSSANGVPAMPAWSFASAVLPVRAPVSPAPAQPLPSPLRSSTHPPEMLSLPMCMAAGSARPAPLVGGQARELR